MENKICVYAICKNESKFVEKWVKSMSEADSIVVLDTGSTDDTYEKLKRLGVTVEQKIINPWRFDVARNESLKLVPDDCNILVCTDLDECFDPGWADSLRKCWVEGVHKQCWYKYTWNHFPDGSDGRIFWTSKIHCKGYKWVFPVHEQLEICESEKERIMQLKDISNNEIKLSHWADITKSRSSYLPLLEVRLEENKEDFCSYIYLGHQYHYSGMEEKCIALLEAALNKFDNILPIEKASCYLFIGDAYNKLGDFYNAELSYRKAIYSDKTYREGYIGLADVLVNDKNDRKNIDEAYYVLTSGLKNSFRHYSWLEREESYSYQYYDKLSFASFYSNHKKDSLLYAFIARELSNNTDNRLNDNVKIILNDITEKDFI